MPKISARHTVLRTTVLGSENTSNCLKSSLPASENPVCVRTTLESDYPLYYYYCSSLGISIGLFTLVGEISTGRIGESRKRQ